MTGSKLNIPKTKAYRFAKMTTKNKIVILISAICVFFAVCGAFYASGYITGRQTQKNECARQLAEINADAAHQIINADKIAHQAVVSKTTVEKLEWLKTHRATK